MNDVTRVLAAIEQGDPKASETLVPLVYEELRKLAAQRLDREPGGFADDATDLGMDAALAHGRERAEWRGLGISCRGARIARLEPHAADEVE
jgi:hypothetical protein